MRSPFIIDMQKIFLVIVIFFFCPFINAQVGISGVKCVLPNIIYQYEIQSSWKVNDTINICMEGGVLAETNNVCIEAQTVSFIRVKWNGTDSSGKITLNSKSGSASLNVEISKPINPGFIQTTDKQTVNFSGLAPLLSCTPATGGNCNPYFSYQWEVSLDKASWEKINGATSINLLFSEPLSQTSFFRRQVLEVNSQTKGYTNEIQVFVIPEIKTNSTLSLLQ
jgi:hypothetical protein